MPYLFLADYYDELGPLSKLIAYIQSLDSDSQQIPSIAPIAKEVARIKTAAVRNVMIFNEHSHYYVNHHVLIIGALVISIHDSSSELDEKIELKNKHVLTENEKLLSDLYFETAELLKELIDFFNTLANP